MRILLISYYFPPCGGAAVQRWHKWLPVLVESGFEVTVLTTANGDYPVLDPSLEQEIPPQVKVLRSGAPSPAKLWKALFGQQSSVPYGDLSSGRNAGFLQKALIWARLNLIIPDARKYWNPSALKAATAFLREHPVDAVITTGPPHSTHLTGLELKKRHRIRWIADWRDPWSTVYYLKLNPPAGWSRRRHRALERKVAQSADLNIVISNHLAEQLPSSNTVVIRNGYDAGKFVTKGPDEKTGFKKFRIKYVGNLTAGQKLAEAASMIGKAFPDGDFELICVGGKVDAEQQRRLDEDIPGSFFRKDFVPHQQALEEMADCELLLLLINYYEGFEGMLTTKLYEYIASGTMIFCLGPHGGEAEELIKLYRAGVCFDLREDAAAVKFLAAQRDAWKAGKSLKNQTDTSELSAQNQAAKLISALKAEKKS